jgi:2-dehydropantoate 2-reductase
VTEQRNILIIGAGAMGGVFAAYLSKCAKVTIVDTNAAHVEAIRQHGLVLTGCTESVTRPEAFASATEMGARRFDAVIVLVKSQATEAAYRAVQPFLQGRPLLATMQNGIGNGELLAAMSDLEIAQGVTLEAACNEAPGLIRHLIRGGDGWLGPVRGGVDSVQWLGDLMTACDLPTKVVADPRGAVWSKFIFNCVMNPVGALLLGVNAARYEVPEICALIDDMAVECRRVAEAQGIRLEFDPMAFVRKTRSGELPITQHAGSIAQDIAAGRETEIEELTGALVKKAKRLGVPVPVTESVYRLAKGLEYASKLRRERG